MTGAIEVAKLAGLLADPTRATICLSLLDGRAWTANELATQAHVAASTASEHLSKLVAGGLLTEWRQGRHRYVALASPAVAELLEGLSAHTGPPPPPARTLRAATAAQAMARARTCYDHLAGQLGVAIADALTTAGLLDQTAGFGLTSAGVDWFAASLDVTDLLAHGRRPAARGCLDWTERRPHLAGVAGARLCGRLFDNGWIVRIGTTRAVRVTAAGRAGLRDLLGVDAPS
jgi:DNA-binding transcriptional ArsR family regulator